MRCIVSISLVAIAALAASSRLAADERAASEFFEKRVRPILATRCFACHGAERQESGLRLDSRAAILEGGDSGQPVVQLQRPEQSRLIQAVRRTGDLVMPPDDQEALQPEEVDALLAWLRMGMPWPAGDQPAAAMMEDRLRQQRATHWALRPLHEPRLPATPHDGWCNMPLDRFVCRRLAELGLAPSPEASRCVLIRRLSFDLIGLPPTPDEVMQFVADERPDAVERLVDRLLASPHYGERWGRHWLDVARYADTRGYAFGRERMYPYAYTYRDYVIDAWNADTPFDQFVREQLAADQLGLPENDPRLAALGFLTVGRRFNNIHDDIDDRIDVVTRGLMGLTVACARCHDHKYDAIPTEDYYSLYGVFASCYEPESLPLIGDPRDTPGYAEFKKELDRRMAARERFADQQHRELLDNARSHATEYLVRAVSEMPESLLQKFPFLSLSPDDVRPKLVVRWRIYLRDRAKPGDPIWGPWAELARVSPQQLAGRARRLSSQLRDSSSGPLNPLVRQMLIEQPPESMIQLARQYGDLLSDVYRRWKAAGGDERAAGSLSPAERQLLDVLLAPDSPTSVPRDEILDYLNRADRNRYRELEKAIESHQARSPGAPPRAMVLLDRPRPLEPRVFVRGNHLRPGKSVPRQFLALVSGPDRRPFARGSGRLELAEAIAADDNPLTPRVLANRIWMHHFGKPLVTTPSDFGVRSDPPSHPELLDWLACQLLRHGWSIKHLHRQILLSAAYRQSSDDRPAAQRVDPENRWLWRMNRRRLEWESLRDSLLAVADQLDRSLHGRPVDIVDPKCRRRTLYGLIDRQDLPQVFRTFDFPNPDQSAEQRPHTIVPQQALFLMNSPLVMQQAIATVQRSEFRSLAGDAERVRWLYLALFSREPTESELQLGLQMLRHPVKMDKSFGPSAQYAYLLMLCNEAAYVD